MKTRLMLFLFRMLWSVFATALPASAFGASSEIRILEIDGVINPLSARYLKREIERASEARVHAVVLDLNTPGGLESSMREMTQAMLASSVPVIVYVTPQGARAASAGMFLTLAAHVAAMAPGTNIGAAHPVGIGRTPEQKPDATMEAKAVNDAAALARSIATERGRNASWAEDAVRKSVSITADEAVSMQVVDFVAADRSDLLNQLNGRRILLRSGDVFLETSQAAIVEKRMRLPEKVLQTLTDPNIAYLLISIGSIGVIAALYSSGLILPGIVGVISLLVGFAAIGSLPISWTGVALLTVGIGLLVLEAQAPGIGIFGVTGILAFILGSLMLYTPIGAPSPAFPRVSVSPWLIGILASGLAGFVLVVFRSAVTAKRHPSAVGGAALIGSFGVAVTDLDPKGIVKIDGEQWSAVLSSSAGIQEVYSGEQVEVVGSEGAILQIRRRRRLQLPGENKLKEVG